MWIDKCRFLRNFENQERDGFGNTVGNNNRNVSRCRTSIVPGTRTGMIGASSPFTPTANPHVNLTKKVPIFGVFGTGLQAFRESRSFMFTQQYNIVNKQYINL